MCLALPAQVVQIHEDAEATINLGGIQKRISISLVPEVKLNDYVLVHVGFAIGIVDALEAERTLQLFAQLQEQELSGIDEHEVY